MKYIVTKADGSPVDPKARYFVLRLDDHGKDAETSLARAVVGIYAMKVRRYDGEASEAAYRALSGLPPAVKYPEEGR